MQGPFLGRLGTLTKTLKLKEELPSKLSFKFSMFGERLSARTFTPSRGLGLELRGEIGGGCYQVRLRVEGVGISSHLSSW